MSRRAVVLVLVAASARLLLQILSMPPWAGLDELYHLARVEFVRAEGRQPTLAQQSMPLQFVWAGGGGPGVPPSFSTLGAKWPEVMKRERVAWPDPPLRELGYHGTNYEAQQPSLWYWLAAQVPARTMLDQLFALRVLSVVFALIVVFVTMRLGTPAWAALLVCVPSWLVLVARASNDALACAAIAVGLLVPAAWPIAIAAKGYAAPLLIVTPFRFSKKTVAILAVVIVIVVAFIALDLRERAGSAVGLQQFASAGRGSVSIAESLKVFVASFAWPGGQHGNALRPIAIIVFLAPLAGLLLAAFAKADRKTKLTVTAAVVAFLGAQGIHAFGFARSGMAGGFEGWYVYALAPLVFGLLLPHLPPRALLFSAVWLLGWDLAIHEGALFRDYAGLTAPSDASSLFRWSGVAFTPSAYGAGGIYPGVWWGWVALLRVVHVVATGWVVWMSREPAHSAA